MRLIDADALRDRLQNLGYDDWNQGTTTTWAEAFSECADMVDEAPTIEPQRKKGRWIEYDNSHCECPFCHEEWSYFDNEVEYFNYCPNCGADMREDGEADDREERWFDRR